MKLHAEDRFIFHPQTFERVIVQAFVSDLHFVEIQITNRNTVIMILCSDQNFSTWQILDRMIPAMMTEL